MIDYHALRAIQAVIENQSFEIASKALGISQSAVSQRIQSIESYLGQKLLIRKAPYKATETGEIYLNLLRKVTILESEVEPINATKPAVKMSINRDSLDLFFLNVLSDKTVSQIATLQIIADDQDNTLDYLKNGQVDMCISSQKKSLPNHVSVYLGEMEYSLVCSKGFYQNHFNNGVDNKYLELAPLVIFDRFDKVQHSYLKKYFKINSFSQINTMPSVLSFKHAILGGLGYGLLPKMDIKKELSKKQLVLLNPNKDFKVPLYLHHWEYQREYIKKLINKIQNAAHILSK